MKKENIKRYSIDEIKKMKSRSRKVEDEDIDFSDIPELDDKFWENAVLVKPGELKESITIRLDADVVRFFKGGGRGYQTRINDVLKSYMQTISQK